MSLPVSKNKSNEIESWLQPRAFGAIAFLIAFIVLLMGSRQPHLDHSQKLAVLIMGVSVIPFLLPRWKVQWDENGLQVQKFSHRKIAWNEIDFISNRQNRFLTVFLRSGSYSKLSLFLVRGKLEAQSEFFRVLRMRGFNVTKYKEIPLEGSNSGTYAIFLGSLGGAIGSISGSIISIHILDGQYAGPIFAGLLGSFFSTSRTFSFCNDRLIRRQWKPTVVTISDLISITPSANFFEKRFKGDYIAEFQTQGKTTRIYLPRTTYQQLISRREMYFLPKATQFTFRPLNSDQMKLEYSDFFPPV